MTVILLCVCLCVYILYIYISINQNIYIYITYQCNVITHHLPTTTLWPKPVTPRLLAFCVLWCGTCCCTRKAVDLPHWVAQPDPTCAPTARQQPKHLCECWCCLGWNQGIVFTGGWIIYITVCSAFLMAVQSKCLSRWGYKWGWMSWNVFFKSSVENVALKYIILGNTIYNFGQWVLRDVCSAGTFMKNKCGGSWISSWKTTLAAVLLHFVTHIILPLGRKKSWKGEGGGFLSANPCQSIYYFDTVRKIHLQW